MALRTLLMNLLPIFLAYHTDTNITSCLRRRLHKDGGAMGIWGEDSSDAQVNKTIEHHLLSLSEEEEEEEQNAGEEREAVYPPPLAPRTLHCTARSPCQPLCLSTARSLKESPPPCDVIHSAERGRNAVRELNTHSGSYCRHGNHPPFPTHMLLLSSPSLHLPITMATALQKAERCIQSGH